MTVAVTSTSGTPTNITASTTAAYSGLTSSGSNPALVACLVHNQAAPSGIAMLWDSVGANQSLTQIGSTVVSGDFGSQISLWGLVNPTPGNKTLTCNWTGSSNCILGGVTLSGVNQTGGTASFANFASLASQPAGATASLGVTGGSTNDLILALFSTFATIASTNDTTIFNASNANFKSASNYVSAASGTNTMTASLGGGFAWDAVGVDIVAAAGAAAVAPTAPPAPTPLLPFAFMRERASGLLEPVRELWRPSRPGLVFA